MTELTFDNTAYKRGEDKGMHKGAHDKAIEMAEKMLLSKETIDKIIEYTGLTEKEIKKIQKQNKQK